MVETPFVVRALGRDDAGWLAELIAEQWGSPIVVAHGAIYQPEKLPGFVATVDGEIAGLATYSVDGVACEIVTLDSLQPNRGIGTALIEAVKDAARRAGCRRLWLITTNDNLHALGFYQRRGFRLVAVHPGAVDEARLLKPQIPLTGLDGIPIHDELELELWL